MTPSSSSPANRPVDPRVRLAIVQWPSDAPRGAVSVFCREQGISRKTFYELRKRARVDGPAAAVEPRSRRPKTSPSRIPDDTIEQALKVRRLLEDSGLDNGPISVSDKLRALGMAAPSPATLARAFRRAGVVAPEPRKRPRSSWRPFVYPSPNDCWQIDATGWVLTGGRTCVIFQVIDDHSRFQVSSLAAPSESGPAAVEVVRRAITKHGVPRRFLSDNGTALNPSRMGRSSPLLDYLRSLGVEAITGKPYKPSTQGKNERFHRTLTQWLSKQPMAESLEELQTQLDEFEIIYNTQRPHQALPERITPLSAWMQTPKAEPPEPPGEIELPHGQSRRRSRRRVSWGPGSEGTGTRIVSTIGLVQIQGVMFHLGKALAGMSVHAAWDANTVVIASSDGEVLVTYPAPGPRGTPDGKNYFGAALALEITPALTRLSRKS